LQKSKKNNELINASLWSGIDTFGTKFIKFIFGIFIARLLLPEEVGVVVILYIFLDVSMAISSAGFQSALINHKSINNIDRNSVFYLNLSIAIVLSLALFFLAKPISVFFDNHKIEHILKILCVVPVINAFSIVHIAYFYRKLDFRPLAFANFPATIASSLIALICAYHNYGSWSLVIQQILHPLIFTSILWAISPFRPKMIFSIKSIKKLQNYSINLLSAGLINKIFENIYYVVIGKFYSPAALGLYSRANSLSTLASQNITIFFSRITFPAISKIKEQKDEVHDLSIKMLSCSTLIIWPLMAFLSASADKLIPFLLTEKWYSSIEYMELLCVWGAIQAINKINMDTFQGCGKGGLILKIEILHKAIIIGILLFTFKLGITSIIIGQIISSIILFIIIIINALKITRINYFDQVKIYLPSFLLSVIIFIIVTITNMHTDLNYAWSLFLQFCTYIFTFIFFCFFFKKKALIDSYKYLSRS